MIFEVLIFITILFCGVDWRGKVSIKMLGLIMLILMGWRSSSADFVAYLSMYQQTEVISGVFCTDIGFALLMYIGNIFGLDYIGFQVIYTAICICLLVSVLKKNSSYPAVLLAIYFLINFSTITIQVRSFMAETIQLIAICKYINYTQEDSENIKHCILIMILATLFHNISVFFIFALLLLSLIKKRKVLLLVVLGFPIAIPFFVRLLKYLPLFIIRDKLQYYFSFRDNLSLSALLYVFIYSILTMGLIWCENCEKKIKDESKWKIALPKLVNLSLVGFIACALIVLFNSNYYRICRVILFSDILIGIEWFFQRKIILKGWTYLAVAFLSFLFVITELWSKTWFTIIEANCLIN